MAPVVEILRAHATASAAEPMLKGIAAAAAAAGFKVAETTAYQRLGRWLVLFGVGADPHHAARAKHVKAGGRAILWDMGYFGPKKSHLRMSIDADHPQQWLDRTPNDGARWSVHGIELREDAYVSGPIVLVGLGRKARSYLREPDWEAKTLADLRRRFPGRQIVYRPKGKDYPVLDIKPRPEGPIEDLLRGASLVVCRHSNVAVDAAIAGVPFECVDGAAMWLKAREFTPENRLDFLRRLAHWQYRPDEAATAWAFAQTISG